MPRLLLVRHGQASFGAADYDQLSPMGLNQCRVLGEYLHARGWRFGRVLRGTLRRQKQSLEAIAQGLPGLPAALERPALNEYHAEAIVLAAAGPQGLPAGDAAAHRREHFRVLRQGLTQWMSGTLAVPGLLPWADFQAGVVAVLDEIRNGDDGADVLVVSSGGPISTASAFALEAPPQTVVALNLQIRNSSVTELNFNAKRQQLLSFNGLPHLDHPARTGWITYS
jgi:broad specificity phosphatase PhoE